MIVLDLEGKIRFSVDEKMWLGLDVVSVAKRKKEEVKRRGLSAVEVWIMVW